MNYVGEILLYSSFVVVHEKYAQFIVYAYVWGGLFSTRMLVKEYSLSKKEGWEEYKKKSWMLIPKVGGNAGRAYLFYLTSIGLGVWIYRNGGFEATAKQFM
jgi:hypothetical protein